MLVNRLNADEMFENLSKEMLDRFLKKNPDFATFIGLHEPYDYLLPNGSTETILDNLHLIEEWIERLNKDIKKEELNEDNQIDWEGWSPFHVACRRGNVTIVELLIAKGADVNAKTGKSYTPLSLAEQEGHNQVVDLLRKHGARE